MTESSRIATESPASLQEICEVLRRVSEQRRTVVPVGHGTKPAMGGAGAPVDVMLSLERMNRILDYPASDLTITVEAGLPIRDLAAALAEKKQFLPLDIPFADQATVGGAIAANSSGPRRLGYGTWRDFVLGMRFVTADGILAKAGGKVVKNVAGYDISKLLVGSQGTLAVIAEVTLKVLPRPPATSTIVMGFRHAEQAAQAARCIVGSQMLPQALDLVDSAAGETADVAELRGQPFTLLAAAAGAEAVLNRVERDLPALARPSGLQGFATYRGQEEASTWKRVQELTPLFLRQHPVGVVVKASIPFTRMGAFVEQARSVAESNGMAAATLARAGSGVVYVYLRVSQTSNDGLSGAPASLASAPDLVLRAAEQHGGRAVVEWCPADLKSKINVWGTLGDDFAWMRKVKAALDPKGILSPGRFYGGI